MATNGTLQLNTNYVQLGLGTLTQTIPATVSSLNIATVNVPFTVKCQVTVPQGIAAGDGSGSGRNLGYGALGGSPGSSGVLETLSHGQTGLGTAFPNVAANDKLVNPTTLPETTPNLPSVALGSGVTGLGSGQSTSDGSAAAITYAAVSSGLSIVVNHNGSPVFTAPAFSSIQSSLQFKTPGILCNAGDTITVVLSSSTLSDEQLQGISANVSVQQGF